MIAVVLTLFLSVLVATGVVFAAAMSHRMAHSPAFRQQVRERQNEFLLKLEDVWLATERVARAIGRRVVAIVNRVTARSRPVPQPAEQSQSQ